MQIPRKSSTDFCLYDLFNFRIHYWPLPGLYSAFSSSKISISLTPSIKFHLKHVLFHRVYEYYIIFIFKHLFYKNVITHSKFHNDRADSTKNLLSLCIQASKVNFLTLQSHFSAIQMICITFIYTCLGIWHSKLQWLPLSATSISYSMALLQLFFNFA